MEKKASARKPDLAIEDDERHSGDADHYIASNREALNASIRQARAEVAKGEHSTRSIDDVIAAGRKRHARTR